MEDEKSIKISVQDLKSIISELYSIQTICYDKLIKDKIEKVLYEIRSCANFGLEISIADVILDKMKQIRYSDEDTYFRLYMLYRKLEDGKITESDAKIAYKMYIVE